MNLLTLVIDRLHVGYLGAYGNTWIETPAFDRLASESFLFDQAFSFTPDIAPFYQALWQGVHPLAKDASPTEKSAAGSGYCVTPLVDRLQTHGLQTDLLTDDPAIADLPAAFGTATTGRGSLSKSDSLSKSGSLSKESPRKKEPPAVQAEDSKNLLPTPCGTLCGTAEETHLAACFSRLVSHLTTVRKPFGFWCHLSSLGKIWDAPYRYRTRYAEEGDPEPNESDRPVETMLKADYDPDELLTATWSYAAGVAILDECLAAMMEYLEELKLLDDTAIILSAPRSYPLGEHRRVGPCDAASYEELVHVPLLIRMPDGTGAAGRSSALVTPLDLFETLSEIATMNSGTASEEPKVGESLMPILRQEKERTDRDRILLGLPHGDRAIRTAFWHMRLTDPPELYVKPDDRWEVNNVADRLPEETEALQAVAQNDAASPTPTEPLPEILRHPPE